MYLSIEKKVSPARFNDFVWLSQKLSDKRQKKTANEELDRYLYYNADLDIVCVVNSYETRILRSINDIFMRAQAQCLDHHMLFTYRRRYSTILLSITQDHNLCANAESKVTMVLDLMKTASLYSEDSYYDGSDQGYAKLVAQTLRIMPPNLAFNFLSTADLPPGYYNVKCGENGPLVLNSDIRTLVQGCIKIPDLKK